MGKAYVGRMLSDRTRLLAQLHAYAACDDEDVREAVQRGYGDLYEYVERVSGASDEEVSRASSRVGMLLNVMAAMDVPELRRRLGAPPHAGCMARRT